MTSTTVLNSTIKLIKDAGALGVYFYLMSKPEDCMIREEDLMNRFDRGRDYIRSCIKVLKELGLYEVVTERDKKGRITGNSIIIHSEQPSRTI